MVITGAGNGIMQASNKGAGKDHSFGVNILLPIGQKPNKFISNDRLINFKYFFTRKLVFLKESDATVLLPGGFGTLDEGAEVSGFFCLVFIFRTFSFLHSSSGFPYCSSVFY